MLLGNGSRAYFLTGKPIGAGLARLCPGAVKQQYDWRAFTTQDGKTIRYTRASVPQGYYPPATFYMADTAGELGSYNEAQIELSTPGLTLAAGMNIEGSTSFEILPSTPDLQLIVSASGNATIVLQTNAPPLSGALAASGNAAFVVATNNPTLGAIIDAIASGTMSISGSGTLTAIGHLSGDILPYDTLSPQGLADAVWSAALETGFSAADLVRLLAAVAVGKTQIVDLGGGNATVTFRDINDSTDRVVADMVGSERDTVTLDPG